MGGVKGDGPVIVVWFADATCRCANGVGTLCHYGCSGGEEDECDFHLGVYGVYVKFNRVVSKYRYRVSGSVGTQETQKQLVIRDLHVYIALVLHQDILARSP
jgi:hypothetical protein